MTKTLVVVESPAKAKTIERYLGSDYMVRASYGHVRDLPKSKLGVDAENTTGAVALYERVGMHVVRRSDTWERRA